MNEESLNEIEDEFEGDDMPEGKIVTKSFKVRGFSTIEGKEQLVEDLKKFYLGERKAGRTDINQIFRDFRTSCKLDRKIWFNPFPTQIKLWIRNWEGSLPLHIRKVPIKGRDVTKHQQEQKMAIRPIGYHELEDGAKNLQQILVADAEQLIKESNAEFEVIDANGGMWDKGDYEKLRMKKKEVALSIAKEVLAGVHKHELVNIKKNKEGRETAGFLMDLMKQSAAGELSDSDLELLEQGVPA